MIVWHIHSISNYHPYFDGKMYNTVFSNLAMAARTSIIFANEIAKRLTDKRNKEMYCTFNIQKTLYGYDIEIIAHHLKSQTVSHEVTIKITKMNVY